MPAPLTQAKRRAIVQDLLVGALGIRAIARKHGVSHPAVMDIRAGIPEAATTAVANGVAYHLALREMEEQAATTGGACSIGSATSLAITVDMVKKAVFQRTKHLRFFEEGSVFLGRVAVEKIKEAGTAAPMADIYAAQRVLKDGMKTICEHLATLPCHAPRGLGRL